MQMLTDVKMKTGTEKDRERTQSQGSRVQRAGEKMSLTVECGFRSTLNGTAASRVHRDS